MGLYCGRVLSEFIPSLIGRSLGGPLVVTLSCVGATMAATRRRNLLGWQWPLYFLLFYVIYPEPHPVTAVFTLLLVLAIYG
ncbi:MAG: hypothetical protein GY803_27485, partial [Chloroflexi bacterium]|nr:hypothetical protein [Chloroflexota bacterium]